MKVLHIIPNDKFTDPFIRFNNKYFEYKEHLFLILGEGIGSAITPADNWIQLRKKISSLIKLHIEMYRSQKIIVHGLFYKPLIMMLFLQPWLLRKSYWVVWGGDLHRYHTVENSNFIDKYMAPIVLKRFGNICTLVKGDYELAQKYYGVKGRQFDAIYTSFERTEVIKSINKKNEYRKNDSNIRIIVGNSAHSANNHFKSLDILKKFKNENIEVICPLSYGNQDHALKVIDYGKKVFGDKFSYIDKFMPIEKYTEFLSTIDVGVYSNNRQQGLGNIYTLLYLGKKVFMRSDTTMWKEMKEELGLEIFDIKHICDLNISDFKRLHLADSKKNIEILDKRYTAQNAIMLWENIYNC